MKEWLSRALRVAAVLGLLSGILGSAFANVSLAAAQDRAKIGEVSAGSGGDSARERGFLPIAALAPATAISEPVGTTMPSPLPAMVVRDDLDAAKRVFAVYAFINAGGYEDDRGPGLGSFREQVRDGIVATADKALLERVRAYYLWHSEVSFGAYGSYALTLGGSGPFTQAEDPPAALRDMLPLLNEFYTKAKVAALWAANQGEIQNHLQETMPLLTAAAQEVFSYSQETTPTAEAFVYVPNPLETFGRASTSTHGGKHYIVEGPHLATVSYINTFRHEVAHSVVGPIVEQNADLVDSKSDLFQSAPGEVKRYYPRWDTFVEESLVRAITARLADLSAPRPGIGEAMYRTDMEMGLFLVEPFVDQLKTYETSETTLREYAPLIFEAME